MFFGRFVTRNPAGVNLMFALVGLLTYSVFYAFPAYRPVAKCVKNFPSKRMELTATGIVLDLHQIPFSLVCRTTDKAPNAAIKVKLFL